MLKRGHIVPRVCIALTIVTFVYTLLSNAHYSSELAKLKADKTMQKLTQENTKALRELANSTRALAKALGGK